MWSINARKLLRRKAELEARLTNSGVDILLVQETWLSEDVESVTLSGFMLAGRLDRAVGPKKGYGGIAVFVRNSLSSLAVLEYSDSAERMWCVLHTHIGAILLGNWYRPPDDDGRSLVALNDELQRLKREVIGTILLGDLNIHHKKWLRFSRENSQLGERLLHICQDNGLKQVVKERTRGDYLLDLVLTDVSELMSVKVLPELSDHKVVCVDLEVAVPSFADIPREVWDFEHAEWDRLRTAIGNTNWEGFLDDTAPDSSTAAFCSHLIALCEQYIPRKTISAKTRVHPWLDEECYRAIEAKCCATGKEEFRRLELDCSQILTQAYLRYQRELREKIASLPRSSKEWWKLNRELLNRKTKNSTIAPLKDTQGKWVLDPEDKANLLASTFQSKSQLPPPPPPDQRLQPGNTSPKMPEFTLVRSRWVLRILKALKEGKASGPDGLPVRIFRVCCKELAPAIAQLTRFLLRAKRWPDVWRSHRVHPLFKKGAVCKPGNYRGVHLTDMLSKVVERTIARIVTPFFEKVEAFGADQWAFRRKRSCRDLVALLVCRWLWALDNSFKVGIYLSDISGAFDRVERELLTDRLREVGLSDALVQFFHDYLAPRTATVVVQGRCSEPFVIDNEVFQGTVLGPPLWNVFFEPIDSTIRSSSFKGAKFADDLTAYKNFDSTTANAAIRGELEKCQSNVHDYGVQRQVSFDASKEHFCIIHRGDPDGEVFRLLGTLIDPKLTMEAEITRIRKKASPKINAILACRHVYTTAGLMQQYKAHVLCILESASAAIYHAAPTHLDTLDGLQRRFLKEIGVTEKDAFLGFNLAPLQLRRDIAVLGLLHKVQLGEAHSDFDKMFPKLVHPPAANTRHSAKRHHRQFCEQFGATDYFNRSCFAAVRIYNVLPPYVVQAKSTHLFQKLLTKDAEFACRAENRNWQNLYNKRLR